MKRIVLTLLIILCAGVTASAQEITKEEFAGLLSPIIGIEVLITDADNPSEQILEFDAIKNLVTAWEIRMGKLEPASLGGYLEGYSNLSEDEKRIVDKAVMLGIAPETGKINKSSFIEKETAKKYVIQLEKSIEIMKNYGVGDVITTFRNESGITGVPDGEITFYAALNEKPRFDNAVLVLALYSDNRLIEVSENFYWNLKNNDFTVMHASVNVPENKENLKIKAFIFDSLRNLRPIYEYKVIR